MADSEGPKPVQGKGEGVSKNETTRQWAKRLKKWRAPAPQVKENLEAADETVKVHDVVKPRPRVRKYRPNVKARRAAAEAAGNQ